ncbi:unnamed protein product, partial [Litomosoides sigmodontis]
MGYFIQRSRSIDLSSIPRIYNHADYSESYLGQWSRETAPRDSQQRYERNIRRSYTQAIGDDRLRRASYRGNAALGLITTPYHTNINYYQEQLPIRKYDVFSVRTWSYPIYKQ